MSRTYTPPLRSANPPGPSGDFTANQVDAITTGLSLVANAAALTVPAADQAAMLALGSTVQVGDVCYRPDGVFVLKALPASTLANWQAVGGGGGGGMTNPMTTDGDLIVGGASGAPTRLAAGTSGQILQIAGGVPAWSSGGAPNYLSSAGGWSALTASSDGHATGLGATITPSKSGVLLINFSFQVTGTDAQSYEVGYIVGTGTPPAFDQASPWTGVVSSGAQWFDSWAAAQETSGSFCVIVDSLTPATPYWLDIYIAFGGSGTCDGGVSVACFEL